jgi:CelD/BcsL family acetyltransferase involved in cellulose biosynthesis
VASLPGPTPSRLALDDPRWNSFVTEHPDATPFHEPAWALLLGETYGYQPFVLALMTESGAIAAGAPFLQVRSLTRRRRWISLPFTDECPLLAADTVARHAFTGALALAQSHLGAPGMQVRGAVDGFGWRTGADAVIHELALDSEPVHLRRASMGSQVSRSIARAEREGLIVRRAVDLADLDEFYALHTRTRQRQGVPVQPRRFFDLLWSRLVGVGLASILLADTPRRRAVAAALLLTGGASTIYKFGASDPDSWPSRPNHLILWTAISEACERGHRRFDFGRTDLGNSGLRAFKSSWGAVERPLRYSTLAPGAVTDGESLSARALGAAIRNGPSWVCRRSGEALYRHAAGR